MDLGFLKRHLVSSWLAKSGRRKSEVVDPKSDFIVPKNEVIDPQRDFPVPQSEVVDPKSDFIVPKSEVVVPKSDFIVPKSEVVVPKSEHTVRQHAWVSHHPDLLPDRDARRARRLSLSLN